MIDCSFLCYTTAGIRLVADFEAHTHQGTPNFIKSKNLETGIATVINYSALFDFFLFKRISQPQKFKECQVIF